MLHDPVLNGHSMAIPSRNIRSVITPKCVVFHDDVLEDVPQGMAHVNVPVGEGWTIVEDVFRRAGFFKGPLVKAHLFPKLEPFGLGLGQVGLHGKGSLGNVEG